MRCSWGDFKEKRDQPFLVLADTENMKMFYYQEFTNLWTAHTTEDSTSWGRADGVVVRTWTGTGTKSLDPWFTQLHIGKGWGEGTDGPRVQPGCKF